MLLIRYDVYRKLGKGILYRTTRPRRTLQIATEILISSSALAKPATSTSYLLKVAPLEHSLLSAFNRALCETKSQRSSAFRCIRDIRSFPSRKILPPCRTELTR